MWPELSAVERDQVMAFGEDFKRFIGGAKSAMTFVRDATKIIEAAGFKPWPAAPSKADVKPRFTLVRGQPRPHHRRLRDRTEPLSRGARIVNTHNDSVFIGLKPRPFRESFDIALLDTITHGGLKNYQWVDRPLAIIGRVTKADGTSVTIDVGHAPGTRC